MGDDDDDGDEEEEDGLEGGKVRGQDIEKTKEMTREPKKAAVPAVLPISKETKRPYHHVKTPDEVDDLPEHEAVEPSCDRSETEGGEEKDQNPSEEDKIMDDIQEKEV